MLEMEDPETHRRGSNFHVHFFCLMFTFGVPQQYEAHISYGQPPAFPEKLQQSSDGYCCQREADSMADAFYPASMTLLSVVRIQ